MVGLTMARAPKAPAGAVEPAEVVAEVVPGVESTTDVEPVQGVSEGGFTHLRIKARREGFRRAGRAWSTTEQTVLASHFSPEQIEALQNEPMLIVTPMIRVE